MDFILFPSSLILDLPKGIFLVGLVGVFIAGIAELTRYLCKFSFIMADIFLYLGNSSNCFTMVS